MSERLVELGHAGRLGDTELSGKQWRIIGPQLLDNVERNAKGLIG